MAEKCFCHVEINGEKIAVKDTTARAAATAAQTAANNAQTLASGISATATNALTVANEAKQIALNAGGSGSGSTGNTCNCSNKDVYLPEGTVSNKLECDLGNTVAPADITGFGVICSISGLTTSAGFTKVCMPGIWYHNSHAENIQKAYYSDIHYNGSGIFYITVSVKYSGTVVTVSATAKKLVIGADGAITAGDAYSPQIFAVEVEY